MIRIGNLSLIVILLRDLKSGHMFQSSSFLKIVTTGEEHGLVLDRMYHEGLPIYYTYKFGGGS